ncbi:hypothetical protein [Lacticaseibacillus paracasei]|uniref:hypothetical protein n=1 Tax=Lacticaseibacillus paracasei TaxID=1597 RepID=UPI0005EBBE88|nr:hypothetical protein [Lacticaseibacillus paracasei]
MIFLVLAVKPIVIKVSTVSTWGFFISAISALVGVVALFLNAINVSYMRKQASLHLDLTCWKNKDERKYTLVIKEGEKRTLTGYIEGFTYTRSSLIRNYIPYYNNADKNLNQIFVYNCEEVYGFDFEIGPEKDEVLHFYMDPVDKVIKESRRKNIYIWIRIYGYEDQYLSIKKVIGK